MHKPKFVLENKTHKILGDFEMDQWILARSSVNLGLGDKKKKQNFVN